MVESMNRVQHQLDHQSNDIGTAFDLNCNEFNYKLHEDTFGVDSEFARNKKRHESLAIESYKHPHVWNKR